MGTKEGKRAKEGEAETIFKVYSSGVKTNRDAWAYNFSAELLANNMQRMIESYNDHVRKWRELSDKPDVDQFVPAGHDMVNDHKRIKWSGDLKIHLKRGRKAEFAKQKIRTSLYRPFTHSFLFFDRIMNNRVYLFPSIFPTPTEAENRVICVNAIGNTKAFHSLMVGVIPDLHLTGDAQCFPFYTYAQDGTNRQENITDWALAQFRDEYADASISKWDIFYYVYALLHHPTYRETYAENLKRALPHIPYAPDFHAFAQAGQKLAELHLHYEAQDEYDLEEIENPDVPMTFRIEKMKLSKDKTSLRVNDFLTLAGIPPAAYLYKLGNRSALHWVIDQYRMKTDKRSGITNDPNRPDDPEYISCSECTHLTKWRYRNRVPSY